MEIYLLRSGEVDLARSPDPYTPPLTAEGRRQAARLGELCRAWGIQLLCASLMIRAQETADAIHPLVPEAVRWEVEELEELSFEDLRGDPTAPPRVAAWTEAQLMLGLESCWIRVLAAWSRIEVYARTMGLERIALVLERYTLLLMLLHWLGHDWRAAQTLDLPVDWGATNKIVLTDDGHTRVEWINRPA